MKATELYRRRLVMAENAFADLVLWRLPRPPMGSRHPYKYRLAYVVCGVCVLRLDNESGKGDHRHRGGVESPYRFTTPERLIADFRRDIRRSDRENSDS